MRHSAVLRPSPSATIAAAMRCGTQREFGGRGELLGIGTRIGLLAKKSLSREPIVFCAMCRTMKQEVLRLDCGHIASFLRFMVMRLESCCCASAVGRGVYEKQEAYSIRDLFMRPR